MTRETLSDSCIESCDQVYEYIDFQQLVDPGIGRSASPVWKYELCGEYYILHVGRKVTDTGSMGLAVDEAVFYGNDVNFEQFDEITMTVSMFPSEKVRQFILSRRDPKLQIVLDLKWLILRTKEHYEAFGDRIAMPAAAPSFGPGEYGFPGGVEPSEEQRTAVDRILNSRISYVWGAPGTGKTQFVLATAIMAYLRAGRRVAVIAPTNNSLEQVLRGLLNIIKRDDPDGRVVDMDHDIIRLGMATAGFIHDYPNICEKKGLIKEIMDKEETLGVLRDVLFERNCEVLKSLFDEIETLYGEEYDDADYLAKKNMRAQMRKYLGEIKYVLGTDPRFEGMARNVDEYNLRTEAARISQVLYNRARPALSITEYDSCPNDAIEDMIDAMAAKIGMLRSQEPTAKAAGAKILAMTPHMFMGRYGPENEGWYTKLDVDHVFIDEIGYCNLIQALPLFSLGVPVTMLGDHKQLPPVCEIESEAMTDGIAKDNGFNRAFIFDMPALYAEGALTLGVEYLGQAYLYGLDPVYDVTVRADLTQSHRFGDNLAAVLNDCVYHNGIRGLSKDPLEIVCIGAVCDSQEDRENLAEAKAVGAFLESEGMSPRDFAVLTPYRKQLELLQSMYPRMKDNILTIHSSQGREWDTVILSVSDSSSTVKEVPLRFTSTLDPASPGIRVINTAVSRAKRRLVIVCDRGFWEAKEDELIGRLVKAAGP